MENLEDLSDSGENNDGTFSFDDSDRFDEMSMCSWMSDPESICGNWRGWKRTSINFDSISTKNSQGNVESLIELSAKLVAVTVPFETVERRYPNLPEQLQLRIAFWSFPSSDDNIRLYSCLANGHAEEFFKGEQLFRAKAVTEPLQIGFYLSGKVQPPTQHTGVTYTNTIECQHPYKPTVVFDRGHVTSCVCTCGPSAAWCSHIVALCLHRIHQPHTVTLRPPVSESLSKLCKDQLQKFSQYLISELPQQLLPYAQKLLDELLQSDESSINRLPGAPDPTAGPSAEDKTQWWMDEKVLRDNVKKMLSKFCGPGPFVLEEVYNLQFASTAPPTAAEWSNLLRPLTAHEPEGMWNLLSIVRELFQHNDPNAVDLLTLLTEECLALEQIVVWWFCSRSQVCGRNHLFPNNNNSNYRNNINTGSTEMTKHACASFCDELVVLWRLACLDPTLSLIERQNFKDKLKGWHKKAIEKARNARFLGERVHSFGRAVDNFPGFTMAIEACNLDWSCVKLQCQKQIVSSPPTLLATKTRPLSYSSTGSFESIDSNEVGGSVQKSNDTTELSETSVNAKKVELPLEDLDEDINILCARAESLQIHGFSEAGCAAVSVAEKILSKEERGKHNEPEEAEFFIKTTLVRAAFLCSMLSQDPGNHHLAFEIGIHGLEVPREPARSKALEVKLANKETDLVDLLKKLPRGPAECDVVRERAKLLCSGGLGQVKAVLPIKLAIFLFQVLVKSPGVSEEDKELGFKAALSVLKMKADVLETEYPMFCEGTRRQRGELALALLEYAKDNPTYLQQVKECLLDKKRYCVDKQLRGQRKQEKIKRKYKGTNDTKLQGGGFCQPRLPSKNGVGPARTSSENKPSTSKAILTNNAVKTTNSTTDSSESRHSSISSCPSDESSPHDESRAARGADSGRDSESDSHEPKQELNVVAEKGSSRDNNHSEGEIAGWGDHSPGEDWGADENHQNIEDQECGWLEDSGSALMNLTEIYDDVGRNNIPQEAKFGVEKRPGEKQSTWSEGNKKKGKKGRSHHDNRSLEAEAHFSFELAKKVLSLAGGATSTTSLYGQGEQQNNGPQPIRNRSLRLCAFELGLFALGLHNITCFNWLSRTYSAHVSWISAQALELGSVALNILLEQWEGHLTPPEVATIAERASKSNDQSTVQKAAQLALSCLDMAHTLNPGHIHRALAQCKEQSAELLESACRAIEKAARGGGVYPEVLFEVARLWEFLYEQSLPQVSDEQGNALPSVSHEPHVPHEPRVPHEVHVTEEARTRHGGNSSMIRVPRPHHIQGTPYGFVAYVFQTPEQIVQQQVMQQVQHLVESYPTQVPYQLASAYRVGMLALETLGRRTPDDQPSSILSRNPPCSVDVHWLCSISNKVGVSSLQQFCRTSVNAIHSPFVLHELALEAAGMMAKSNPTQIAFHLRSPSLSPMVQKCLLKYGQGVQQSLTNLPKSEYPEFVELIMHARGAFCMAPGGITQFNDLLQSIRRNTAKKRDLWQRITTGLAQYQNNPTK